MDGKFWGTESWELSSLGAMRLDLFTTFATFSYNFMQSRRRFYL